MPKKLAGVAPLLTILLFSLWWAAAGT